MSRSLHRSVFPLAAMLLLCSPAATQPANSCPPSGQAFQSLVTAKAEVAYRWEPASVKVGQFFSAEVMACRPNAGVTRINLDATMPAHGHGMNYRPTASQVAPGHYRFTGLMLHMPGRWQIVIDLYDDTRLLERLTRDIDLKP